MNKIFFLLLLSIGLQVNSHAASFLINDFTCVSSNNVSKNYMGLNVTKESISSIDDDDLSYDPSTSGANSYGSAESDSKKPSCLGQYLGCLGGTIGSSLGTIGSAVGVTGAVGAIGTAAAGGTGAAIATGAGTAIVSIPGLLILGVAAVAAGFSGAAGADKCWTDYQNCLKTEKK